MTVYLKPGMAFEPQKKNLKSKRSLQMRLNYRKSAPRQSALVEIFHAFIVSSLVVLNIALIAIAAVWYLLLFSIFHPAELLSMYQFQAQETQVVEETEYTLEIVNMPPPPLEKLPEN